MNPAKAPWYFLGLQEMLVYFDPWIAGVVMPTLIVVGLMIIPYVDTNPLGSGYYTWKQRKFSILTFCFGFLFLWVLMVIVGTFIRGPGWMWFWPGQTVGPQPGGLRSEPRFAGHFWHHHHGGQSRVWRHRDGPVFWRRRLLVSPGHYLDGIQPEDLQADEPGPVPHAAIFPDHHAVVARQDDLAAGVSNQVRVGDLVV